MNVLKITIWFVLVLLGVDKAFSLLSQANTLKNVVGFFFIIIIILVSYKTKYFTKIKFKKHGK